MKSFSIGDPENSGLSNIQLSSLVELVGMYGINSLQEMGQTGFPVLQELRSEPCYELVSSRMLTRRLDFLTYNAFPWQLRYGRLRKWECTQKILPQLIEFRVSTACLLGY